MIIERLKSKLVQRNKINLASLLFFFKAIPLVALR